METKEYKLLDGRTIRVKYDRLRVCKISRECLEAFVKEFNTSYRQAKIFEKIKENYALMKTEERKKGKWVRVGSGSLIDDFRCDCCNKQPSLKKVGYTWGWDFTNYCPHCGAKMEIEK